MPIQQFNIDQMKLHRDYIYDTIMYLSNQATDLPCYVERENLNRPDSTYVSMIIESMNPLGYYNQSYIGVPDGETTDHSKQYVHYEVQLTINTWKQDANAYLMAIQAALKNTTSRLYMADRNIGWLSESSILNNSTVLDEAWEERATILVTLNSYIGNIDTSEFEYLDKVELSGGVYTENGIKATNDTALVIQGQSVQLNLAANDFSTATIDLESIVITTEPSVGTVVVDGGGLVTYTNDGSPTLGDSFQYTINDTAGRTSNIATVTLTIGIPPVANNDSGTVDLGDSLQLNVAINDTPYTTLDLSSIVITTPALHGTVDVDGNGLITYTNDGNTNVSDSFGYTIDNLDGITSNEATVNMTLNQPPTVENIIFLKQDNTVQEVSQAGTLLRSVNNPDLNYGSIAGRGTELTGKGSSSSDPIEVFSGFTTTVVDSISTNGQTYDFNTDDQIIHSFRKSSDNSLRVKLFSPVGVELKDFSLAAQVPVYGVLDSAVYGDLVYIADDADNLHVINYVTETYVEMIDTSPHPWSEPDDLLGVAVTNDGTVYIAYAGVGGTLISSINSTGDIVDNIYTDPELYDIVALGKIAAT